MNLLFREALIEAGEFRVDLNLELHSRATGIFGPSGAGKTTVLEMVAGLRKPQRGGISFDGQLLSDVSSGVFVPAHRRGIGYVPQDLALFPHFTVRGNLSYGMKETASMDHLCEMLEIGRLLDRFPHSLSGGEKQRVAFARALLASPKLLLLDEPLASLDHNLKDRILPYLLRIRAELEIPIIYVTHAAEEIVTLCEEVLVLENGRCVRKGSPEEVFSRKDTVAYRYRED